MSKEFKIVDLTHTISPLIPTFDGKCHFHLSVALDYNECQSPNIFRVNKMEAQTGIGTHLDAPAHAIPGGQTVEALDIKNLVVDCVVIRVEEEAHEKYMIMPEVVEKFEKDHGKIPPNSFVIFYTGWEKFWSTPEKYHNGHKYPAVLRSTAELLLKREIAGIGTDTLSADAGGEDFPVHRVILGAGKYLVENIANAKDLPPTGAKIIIAPMKIKDGTEAPIRLIALI